MACRGPGCRHRRLGPGPTGPRPPWRGEPGSPVLGFGGFTVPLGLAVLGIGIAGVDSPAQAAAAAVTGGAWVSTVLLLAIVAVPTCRRCSGVVSSVGRRLVPRAHGAAGRRDRHHRAARAPVRPDPARGRRAHRGRLCVRFRRLLWLVVVLAAARVAHAGVAGAPRVLWWIPAGCGGLAAAVRGHARPALATVTGDGWVRPAALAAWIAGSLLLLPVLAASCAHLARWRRFRCVCWPPTFSTAMPSVPAWSASLTRDPILARAGQIAGSATVLLWLATTVIYTANLAKATVPPSPSLYPARQTRRCFPIAQTTGGVGVDDPRLERAVRRAGHWLDRDRYGPDRGHGQPRGRGS